MTNRYLNNANRPLMATACFVAAFVLSACGGEGVGDGSRLDSTVPYSERENSTGSTNESSSDEGSATADGSGTNTGGSDVVHNDSSTSEDGPLTSEVSSAVVLRWSVPTSRKNGDALSPEELGGYEIRYRKASESEFRSIPIDDALQKTHYFDEELSGDYEFQIAAYDSNGLYSEFINLTPFEES